ncbi:MAG: ABC transporter permease [Pseudomonadota bacterium]
MTQYAQTQTTVSEYSELSILQRTDKRDIAYVVYGIVILLMVVCAYLMAIFGWLPHDPEEMQLELMLAGPGAPGHLLGTDFMGRDTLPRLILVIKAYFVPGLMYIAVAILLGGIFGILSGYYGNKYETVVTYITNIIDSFPRLILMLLVVAAFKPDIYYIMMVLGVTNAPLVSQLIKGKISMLRQKNFVESAIALGIPDARIIFKHILWFNCRSYLIIQATLGMGEAILLESALSYLGFGVQEPTPSWGNMVQQGANYLLQGQLWSSTIPAMAIMFTVLGFYLLGDGLNNMLEGKRQS